MFWKLSLLTLFAAVAFAGYNIVAGTENWGPSFFAAVLMFAVATTLLACPYVVLGILAFLMRSHRALSATLFSVILLISVLGITLLSLETHAYLNRNKALPEATNLGIFFVGVVQWISAILLSCIMLPVYLYLGSVNPQSKSPQEVDLTG